MTLLKLSMFETANYIESAFWIALGIGFAVYSVFIRNGNRSNLLAASATLVLFGLSDIIEAHTGAWWRPWWLFLWKAACVLILATLVFQHYQRRSAQQNSESK